MIGSVQKTLKILNTISEEKNRPVSLSYISTETGINKSTCSHIISTLVAEGFVKKFPTQKVMCSDLQHTVFRDTESMRTSLHPYVIHCYAGLIKKRDIL